MIEFPGTKGTTLLVQLHYVSLKLKGLQQYLAQEMHTDRLV